MKLLKNWLVIVLCLAVPVTGLAIGVAIFRQISDAEAVATPEEVWLPATAETLDASQPVELTLTWGEGRAVPAPAWSGTVTKLGVALGDAVASGSQLLQIDGIWRLAVASSMPLYVSVSEHSSKAEKELGVEVLRLLGYSKVTRWDWDAVVAVRDLATKIGVPAADTIDALDPSWLVWLEAQNMVVGSFDVQIGQLAPAAGEAVFTTKPPLLSISPSDQTGVSLPAFDGETSWALAVGDARVNFTGFPLVDPAALGTLGVAVAEKAEQARGTLALSDVQEGWAIPARAVVADDGGKACVFVASETGTPTSLMVDQLPGAGPGVSWVSASSQSDGNIRVLTNPSEFPELRSCD